MGKAALGRTSRRKGNNSSKSEDSHNITTPFFAALADKAPSCAENKKVTSTPFFETSLREKLAATDICRTHAHS